jgi:tetratricopeptide (TPR) repeat protein
MASRKRKTSPSAKLFQRFRRQLSNIYILSILFFYLPSVLAICILSPLERSNSEEAIASLSGISLQAKELIRVEDYDSAIAILGKVVKSGQSDVETIFLLGLAYDMSDNIPEAIKLYHRAIEADSLYWYPYKFLGYLFDIFAQYDSMNFYLQRAARLSPSPESLYYDLAYSYDMLALDDSAMSYYHRAIAFDSLDGQAFLNIGAIWGRRDKIDSAAAYTRLALRVDPNIPAACYNMAEIFIEENRYEEAIDQFQKALALDPNLVAAKKRLGELYEALGDSTMAEIYFREFVDTAPMIYLHDIDSIRTKLNTRY